MPFEIQGGWAEEKWRLTRNKLLLLAHISCHRLKDVRAQRELRLPETMEISDQDANTVLVGSNRTSSYDNMGAHKGSTAASSNSKHYRDNTARGRRRGIDIWTVYKRENRAHITGAITAFNDEIQDYTITFQKGNIKKWKPSQVYTS